MEISKHFPFNALQHFATTLLTSSNQCSLQLSPWIFKNNGNDLGDKKQYYVLNSACLVQNTLIYLVAHSKIMINDSFVTKFVLGTLYAICIHCVQSEIIRIELRYNRISITD